MSNEALQAAVHVLQAAIAHQLTLLCSGHNGKDGFDVLRQTMLDVAPDYMELPHVCEARAEAYELMLRTSR